MIKRPERSKYITPGAIIFNIIFILAYPIIAVFYLAFNVLVWFLSIPSRMWAYVAKLIRK
ncbi:MULTISPECIES: hypothetical protein [unclassified Siphonobacter]|uniref:hypothetical protein n=1 Tax=unclassified Siphonobacter TaxID=2635712 RepID=UPI000CA9D549|nr:MULTISPECIES: hypothetical protein [unclassified Siphonobacter]MDQ1088222.1 hypothetical protein [Siphonobacter sp. SORGH_AS_1065]MDR6194368.1 hypothetical protein [Siphonobacter sp. SORGH_AS_0500]PKK37669.1 hypothetical protein BWI96_04145 [Siphonobacter sp. SORGH_AS_0500]